MQDIYKQNLIEHTSEAIDESPRFAETDVAVIGIAARLPGAANLKAFWRNLCEGLDAVSEFSDDDLRAAGVDESLINNPKFVKAGVLLDEADRFDAAFFGMSPTEAEIMDPQHRIFLEICWQAIESAAYDPYTFKGLMGIFAGSGFNSYLIHHILPNQARLAQILDPTTIVQANDKDFMPLRVAYKLNLKGPAINVQTACSTSLVAVHQACQSIINGECDMALAGGVAISPPMNAGYLHHEGSISSPDGRCRAFDAEARGTVSGNGAGVVLLKSLNQAVDDGDRILGVIKGSAVNNDGAGKVSFSAPSVEGQAAAIADAYAVADVDPATVSFIEAHGTGTTMGDPIEIQALARAFGESDTGAGYCAITSTKANIGHLDAAAGVTGLIKALMCLQHRQIPPSMHCHNPNPSIDFENTPFFVNTELAEWTPEIVAQRTGEHTPLRAGVSSLGMGGTNAHVVLEEAPQLSVSDPALPDQLLLLSARTPQALAAHSQNLADWLKARPEVNLADVAFSLQNRAHFMCRRVLRGLSATDASAQLEHPETLKSAILDQVDPPLVFMFTGQGSQRLGMTFGLYDDEPLFQRHFDQCAEILGELGFDLHEAIFSQQGGEEAAANLAQTSVTQPALFAVEYALAMMWQDWGLTPEAMIGHSIGEYVAATIAGVFSLEDALALVLERGRLMQGMETGSMLAVCLPEEQLDLGPDLWIAAVNAKDRCVVSGSHEAIAAYQTQLTDAGVTCKAVLTSHAFHSGMMDRAREAFVAFVRDIPINAPEIPFISNLTGTWADDRILTAEYWGDHLRGCVRFYQGVTTLMEEPGRVFLEVGPGRTLTSFLRRHSDFKTCAAASLGKGDSDRSKILTAMSELWLAGISFDWSQVHQGASRRRVLLPGYPFERQRFWLEAQSQLSAPATPTVSIETTGHQRPELATAFAGPSDDQERAIAAVWRDILGVENPGIHDAFSDLGGDSIMTTQVAARLRAHFGCDVSLDLLFEHETITSQAEAVRLLLADEGREADDLTPVPRDQSLPLSHQQQRMWLLEKIDGPQPAYTMVEPFRFKGRPDKERLFATLDYLVARHETLRISFPEVDGQAIQYIHPPVPIERRERDLSDESAPENALHDLIKSEILLPFDLQQGPLFRPLLVRLAQDDHVLVVCMHHIISDAWSYGIFAAEMVKIYGALSESSHLEDTLPNLPIQYADYASWQRQRLQGERLERHIQWWTQALQGAPGQIDLPTDFQRPPEQTFHGARIMRELDQSLANQLRQIGQDHGATMFMVLHALLALFLKRITGQSDILIGAPIANRSHKDLEGVIGFFVNTLVLRARVGEGSFIELLDQIRRHDTSAYAHQDAPFEKVVEAIDPIRDVSRTPLFQVMLVLQNAPVERVSLPGMDLVPFEADNPTAKFDLTLYGLPTSDGALNLVFEYNTDLFSAQTIDRLAFHFQHLARSVTTQIDAPISRLDLLGDVARNRLITDFNQTKRPYDTTELLHAPFEKRAIQNPDQIALILSEQTMSYAELNRRADVLARFLVSRGVLPDTPVAVCISRSFEMVVALYGILKAGAGYAPVDPDYPAERQRFMLEDSHAAVTLTQESFSKDLPHGICLDRDWSQIEKNAPQIILPKPTPQHMAYVIYTSGSTGRPKGVINSHAAICNRLNWMQEAYPIDASDRILQKTPFSFDVSVWEFFWPLREGAALVIAEPGRHGEPDYLARAICAHQITTMHFVPSMMSAFLADEHPPMSSLRQVFSSGEALPANLCDRFFERLGDQVALHNLYGPTEAAVDVTFHRCHPGMGKVYIGRPIANTQTHIIDRAGELLPIGCAGELHLAGHNLARGYHNRPALTAERFVPNPYTSEPGQRMYRTGDLTRMVDSGDIDYLGRIDHQVKLRGLRIELGEIQSALASHPSVDNVEVLVVNQPRQRLVAYITGSNIQETDLSSWLSRSLPDYMIPSAYVFPETMPLTPNGKVDRKALAAIKPDASADVEFIEPRNPIEQKLAQVWRETLGVATIGIHDNFFELGGDSILSVLVVSRAAQTGVHFNPRQLFANQTIARLAPLVTEKAAVVAEQGPVIGPLPLTPIQKRFFDAGHPNPHHYNQAIFLKIAPEVDRDHLALAVRAMYQHHDALRLRYRHEEGEWLQQNEDLPAGGLLEWRDLSELPDDLVKEAEAIQASLSLENGPIARFVWMHLGKNTAARLLIIIHHLAVDGVSWRILLEDLMVAYEQASQSKKIKLPPKTTAYRDWALRMQEHALSDAVVETTQSWLTILDGAKQPSSWKVSDKKAISCELDENNTRRLLGEASKAWNTRIQELLLTALARSGAAVDGCLLLDTETHGRDHAFDDIDLSHTMGWFTGVHPLRLTLSASGDPIDDLKTIKEQMRAIPRNGFDYPLLRYLNPSTSHDFKQKGRPGILFNYLGQVDQVLDESAIFSAAPELIANGHDPDSVQFHDIDINAVVSQGKLRFDFEYTPAYSDKTMQRMSQELERQLKALIERCCDEPGGYTPSDFELIQTDQQTLDRIISGHDIEDIYPLTPLQEGMLFHASFDKENDPYFGDLSSFVKGDLDVQRFRAACMAVIDQHPGLRASYLQFKDGKPLQRIHRKAAPEWVEEDWRDVDDIPGQLALRMQTERARGFVMDQAPLMRFILLRVPDGYRFICCYHHIIIDGWSRPLILKGIFEAYQQKAALSKAPAFRDYVSWMLKQEEPYAYWSKALAGFESPTPLPGDMGEPASEQNWEYDEFHLELSADIHDDLKQFARTHHLTLYAMIQGAWALTLSHLTGERDLMYGATVAGRPSDVPDVAAMVGMFINTLPVRVKLPDQIGIIQWLKDILLQQNDSEAYAHAALTAIHAQSDVPRSEPLFNSLLVFENYPESMMEQQEGGSLMGDIDVMDRTSFPFSICVHPVTSLMVRVGYDKRRLSKQSAHQLAQAFIDRLSALRFQAGKRLMDLERIDQKQRDQILTDWNATSADYPKQQCVHQLIEARAAANPDRIAIDFHSQTLSYAELNTRANRLAHHLLGMGIGIEDGVGVYAHRSLEMVVAMLAVMKTGAFYVPMDPIFPQDRLAMMIEDAGISVLLTQKPLEDNLQAQTTLLLENPLANESTANPDLEIDTHHLAYVIYTSGSSGRPKGVSVNHQSVNNFLHSMAQRPGLTEDDVFVAVTTISFDISALELYLPLMIGARLVLADADTAKDGQALAACLQHVQATVMQATPITWRLLLESGWRSDPIKVLCGGEALPMELARAVLDAGHQLWNLYGPTETTIWSSAHRVLAQDLSEKGSVTVGRPIANTELFITDELLRPVPQGCPGLLLIGGDGLARGYFGKAALTAERFTPHPFADRSGARVYHTGDQVRYLEDGKVVFLSRADGQVKLRGYRIELGEIEAVLDQHDSVHNAVVLLLEKPHPRLAAYVRLGHDTPFEQIRDDLRTQLPDYMVPSLWTSRDSFPLTANGKIDRRALARETTPDALASTLAPHVAPRNAVEMEIARIWQKHLGLHEVGVHDDFFELGGHSLIATYLAAQLSDLFEGTLKVRDLFDFPTIAQLAQRLDGARDSQTATPITPQPRPNMSEPMRFPVSSGQQRLWVLSRIEGASAAYNMAYPIRIKGAIDRNRLEQAITLLLSRHETLRTTFEETNGVPVQVIHPFADFHLPHTDLTHFEGDKEDELARLRDAHLHQAFDLEKGPLFRMGLVHLALDEHALLLTMHHAISDGWSMGVMIRDIIEAYAHLGSNSAWRPEPLAIQYADVATLQKEASVEAQLGQHLQWWRDHLKDAPTHIELPLDRPRPAVQTFNGAQLHFEFEQDLAQNLKRFAKKSNSSLFMLVQALFTALLHRYSGQSRIVIGTPIANRERSELADMIGFFANTLALQSNFESDPDMETLTAATRDVNLQAYSHQSAPFEQVVDLIRPERDLSRNPVFQVMLVWQNASGQNLPDHTPGLELEPLQPGPMPARFELTLSATETDGGLCGYLEYNTDLFEPATAQRMVHHFKNLAASAIAHPNLPISNLQMMDQQECELLASWNHTAKTYPNAQSLLAPFEAFAQSDPDRDALHVFGETFSYGQLNRSASQLAGWLEAQGVGREDRVAVCMDRSAEMVIALYGVIKAGAVYVPLDPGYPSQRLAYMLEDSRPAATLTQDKHRHLLEASQAPVASLDGQWSQIESAAPLSLTPLSGSSAAYAIYTSGSTGKPKCAVNTHEAICNRIDWMQDTYQLVAGDRILQKTPFSFDVSVWEFFWALRTGASIVMAKPGLHGDPAFLCEVIEQQKVTTMHFVPSMLQAFLAEADVARLSSLRQVFCSGEALPVELSNRFLDMLDCELHNLYGPTEAAIDVTYHHCQNDPQGKATPIGRAIANTSIHILDPQGNPVPVGIAGELHIGGLNLARGYHGRPALTSDRFVPDAVTTDVSGARLYKTGDLARHRHDGAILYLGRIDHQIKLRGFRIELGEIEAALNEHPRVADAAVLVSDSDDRQILMSWLVFSENAIETAELRSFLAERLPQHMIPAFFVELQTMPLTPNGKRDRKALLAIKPDLSTSDQDIVEPETREEKELSLIWKKLLRLECLSVTDNFFALGGDSILGLQIISAARRVGLVFTLKDLFEHQTIRELALAAGAGVAVVAEQGPVTGDTPLTPIQRWFFDMHQPEPHHYNLSLIFKSNEPLDAERLEQALQALTDHHDALRLRFEINEQSIRQSIAAPEPVTLHVHSLKSPDEVGSIAEIAQAGLNLQDGPLFQLHLMQLPEQARLLIVAHHLVIDGLSWRILLEDLQNLYQFGSQAVLPDKTTSFKTWAQRLTQHAASDVLEAETSWWADLPKSEPLPIDQEGRIHHLERDTAWERITLDEADTDALLREVPQAYNTRIDDTLLAALASAFHHWTGRTELMIDLEGHGREDLFEDVDHSRTVGWFTSKYPVLLQTGPNISDTLKKVKEHLRAIPNKGMGYGLLRGVDAIPERQPEVMFNYFGQLDVSEENTWLEPATESSGSNLSPKSLRSHLFVINAFIEANRLSFDFGYSAAAHHVATVAALAESCLRALRELIQHVRSGGGGATASDFEDVDLGEEELDALVDELDFDELEI